MAELKQGIDITKVKINFIIIKFLFIHGQANLLCPDSTLFLLALDYYLNYLLHFLNKAINTKQLLNISLKHN